MTKMLRVLFPGGDCAAGAVVGVVTTLAVRAVVSPGSDMVGAMMVGMMVGILGHLVVGMALSPLLGMFGTMVPGMFETVRRREGISPARRTTRVVVRACGGAMPSCISNHGHGRGLVSHGSSD